MSQYVIGIDLGGTNAVIAILDRDGNPLSRDTFPSQVGQGPDAFVRSLKDEVSQLLANAKVRRDQILAVGVGSPGPLSVSTGRIIKAGNMPKFTNYPLRASVSAALGVPGILENDANAACYGEFWRGAGEKVRHMVMFTLGTGIGGGIVINGEMVHGCDDNGGELGHMIIVPNGRLCSCGQRGCVEAYASATHTAARAIEALESGQPSSLQEVMKTTGVTSKDVFEHAQAGDPLALEVWDGTCRALAQMCVNMRHATEPEMIVLAGGMILAGDFLLERVQRYTQEMFWQLKHEDLLIALATLGGDAGAIGAAGLALKSWQEGTLPAVGV